jgi:putative MATE family efflux protein
MDSVKHIGEQPIGRLLVRYSLPAIAGFLANALYQFVDRVMVGRGVGTDAVAAVTSAFPLSIVALALGLLVGTGTGNRISVLLGKRDTVAAERVLGQGLRLALINGTLLAIVTWLFTKPLLLACGCSPELLPMAVPFARIVAVGQIFMIALLSMGNIMRVQGWPVFGFLIMLSSNVLNALLAALAVFELHWGVTGTALATTTSQVLGCLAVVTFVQSRRSSLHIRPANLKANRTIARSIISLGAPFGIMQILATLVFLAANHGAGNQGGTRGVAALGVLNTVAVLLIYPPLGVMQAMQPLVGFNKGAGRQDRVRAILVRVLLTTTSMGVIFSVLIALFPRLIASLFSKSDFALIELVQRGLPWFVIPIALFGISGTMSHYFLSIHEPRKAGVLLLGRQLVAIPLFLLLPRWLGFKGVYLVSPCADLPFAAVATGFMVRELARLKRDLGQKKPTPRRPEQDILGALPKDDELEVTLDDQRRVEPEF